MNEQGGVISYHFLLVIMVFILVLSLVFGGWGSRWWGPNAVYSAHTGAAICLLLMIFKLIGWI